MVVYLSTDWLLILNLMISKDERTLKILEYTKDTIEKFKTQGELLIINT